MLRVCTVVRASQNLLLDVRRAVDVKSIIASLPHERRNNFLKALIAQVSKDRDFIFSENQKDCELFSKHRGGDKVTRPGFVLTEAWMNRMLEGVQRLIEMPDPLGSRGVSNDNKQHNNNASKLPSTACRNDITIEEVSVPLGLIGVISRFRPRIALDAVAMSIKSGNVLLLDAGVTVANTNRAIVASAWRALADVDLPTSAIVHTEADEKNISTSQWLTMNDFFSVALVCGSTKLLDYVSKNTSIPIIQATGHTCSLYVDKDADFNMALRIVLNAKLQRPNATNSINNLLIDSAFPKIAALIEALSEAGLRVLGDSEFVSLNLPSAQIASEEDWMGLQNGFANFHVVNVKIITKGLDEAAMFIETYGSRQSDGIITGNKDSAEAFVKRVDSAVVYVNASTRFSSGECFGLGTDLAIATSRMHCRGPVCLPSLTTRKFVVRGTDPNGSIR